MREYNPDRWTILKIRNKGEVFYKVFGNWSGGYLDGDSWRLSSGLKEIEEDGNYYLMKNESGSVYKCHKEANGMNAYGASVYYNLVDEAKRNDAEVDTISVEEFLKETKQS